MRKKISVLDLKLGMFVDELCGSWMEHPFFRSAFKLTKAKDLQTLQQCGITDVWIDTSKGLDVAVQAKVASENDEHLKTNEALLQATKIEQRAETRVSLDEELDTARKIQTRAKLAITSMFQEARMGKALPIGETASLVEEISQSITRNPGALISLARLKTKDDYTYLHSVAVCALMIALGKQLNVEDDLLQSLGMAGLLHDIGKMAIPDDILNKPGRLTDEEFEIIKTHSMRGWEVLKDSEGVDDIALDVCRHHHERIDGNGYPDRLSGENLTLYAKMGAVCDVYDAITSNRSYKNGWEPADSIRKMAEWKNGHFDETVFNAFVKTVGIYPAGTLVKLQSGRLGVVTDQSAKSLLTPKVKVFFSSNAKTPIPMKIIDLAQSQESITSIENPGQWGFDLRKITGV